MTPQRDLRGVDEVAALFSWYSPDEVIDEVEAVHLVLLPTNQDRAKAVVDWSGATFTHQRVGRITVGSD